MRLNDIDILNEWRRTYNTLREELKAAQENTPPMVQFKSVYVKHPDVMKAVRQTIIPMLEQRVAEAKTKLMMLGIDEFPE